MTLINKDSIRNTTGSRWDFDLAFLQWDTYADPNHYALTRSDLGKATGSTAIRGCMSLSGMVRTIQIGITTHAQGNGS